MRLAVAICILVFPTTHQLLFVLLPTALAVRAVVNPRPDVLEVARGVMRFCLGFAKWVLLVCPLWHLSAEISAGSPESLSRGVAWMGLLARLLSLHFIFTGIEDLVNGLAGLFGFKVPSKLQDVLTCCGITHGKLPRWLGLLLVLSLAVQVLQQGVAYAWPQMEALFISPPVTAAAMFQKACVWTDFHVLSMAAAISCLLGLPCSREFLRVPAAWKAVPCLLAFLLAITMLWTHVAPLS